MPFLELEDVRAGYGQIPVLHGVDLSVDEGQIAVLLGLNGAGKTTTLLAIAGLLRRTGGRVIFDGKPLGREPAHELVRRGIVLCPEGRHVFPALSVENNLRLGAWSRRRDRALVQRNLELALEVFPPLS